LKKSKVKFISVLTIFLLLTATISFTGYPYLFPEKRPRHSYSKLPEGIKADSIIVFKEKREMILMASGKELKKYSVSLGKNPVGDKQQEGDKKTPEGIYKIEFKNANSKYHLSLRISYPDEKDKADANAMGVSPGSDIMIHGLPNNMNMLEDYYLSSDWTDGCIAVSNEEIEEIWSAVNIGTPIMITR
jgi:murein L,D-transpeptidase YafK